MQISNDSSWEDKECHHSDRNGFIRKVYSIISLQLLITAAVITWVKLDPVLNEGIKGLYPLVVVALISSVFIECALICC